MKTNLIKLPLPLDTLSLLSLIIKSASLRDLITLIMIAILHSFIIFIPVIILNYIMSLLSYYQVSEGTGLLVLISIIMVTLIISISITKVTLQIALVNKIVNLSILGVACRILLLNSLIKSNNIINKVYQYKYGIEEFIRALTTISFNIISILIFTFAVFFKSYIAGIIVFLYSIAVFLSSIILAKLSYIIQQSYIEITSKLCSYNFEIINGISKVITNNIQLQVLEKFQNLLSKKVAIFKKFILILQWQTILFMFFSLAIQKTLYIALYLSQVQINDIMFVVILSSQTLWFSMETSMYLRSIYIFRSKVEGIKTLDNFQQEKNSTIYDNPISGHIRLINLSFKCLEFNTYLFNNINIVIEPKAMICVRGKSGVGKTTLIRIITGFEQPSSGTVSFDFYHLKNTNLRAIRQQIGIILQNHVLFPGSIREVVAGDQKCTDEELYNYLLLANFQEDFTRLNLTLDSILGPDSIKLSKGQEQKLIIAQTLAKKPKILILDEALSAIDNESYLKILNNIRNLQLTTIITTHRKQGLDMFDYIYTLIDKQLIKGDNYAI